MAITTISGGIFDFTESGYIPPTWSGTTYLFGDVIQSTLYQIWTDSNYIYCATEEGLAIVPITV